MNLSERWSQLWISMGCQRGPTRQLADLLSRYAQPWRAYHTISHIQHCLTELDGARHLCRKPEEVEAAIWYHDAVYDPKANDNEEKSAQLAQKSIAGILGGTNPLFAGRVAELIQATKHARSPGADPDMLLLLDVDLAILGQSREDFEDYERSIRREYEWVKLSVYCRERAKILRRLAWPTVYQTPFFQERYEGAAQDNLSHSIALLENQMLPGQPLR